MKDIFLKAYDFWFGDLDSPSDFPADKSKIWFSAAKDTDRYLRDHFQSHLEQITKASHALLDLTKKHQLGLILMLDQFSRNIYRHSPRAFEHDAQARLYVHEILDLGATNFYPIERTFLYLPLEHSEHIEDQNLSVHLYEKLYDEVAEDQKDIYNEFLDYAHRHRRVIEQFGRFPHRNKILGRPSTQEELDFLKENPMGF